LGNTAVTFNFFPDLSTYYRKLYTITSASIVSCSNEVLIGQRQLTPTLVSNAFRYDKGKTFINGKKNQGKIMVNIY
jgi:hypothetical protein